MSNCQIEIITHILAYIFYKKYTDLLRDGIDRCGHFYTYFIKYDRFIKGVFICKMYINLIFI